MWHPSGAVDTPPPEGRGFFHGPSLRSGLCRPGPSTLNRPHPPHSRAPLDFTDWRLVPDAFAVPISIGLGDLRLVPCFRCCSFSTCRPLRPRGVHRLLVLSCSPTILALAASSPARHSRNPIIRFRCEGLFGATLRFAGATACRFARLPGGSDRVFAQPTETFTSELSRGRSPPLRSDMTTVATEQVPPGGSLAHRNPN